MYRHYYKEGGWPAPAIPIIVLAEYGRERQKASRKRQIIVI